LTFATQEEEEKKMKSKRWLYTLLVGLMVSTMLAACAQPTPAPTEAPPPPAPAPTEAVAEPTMAEPTEVVSMIDADATGQSITFWHAMSSGANLEGMTALVDEFNANNEYGITVEAVAQGSQSDLETAFNGAIATGELPSLTMGFANGLVRWYGLDVITGLNQYIDDPVYGLSDEVKAGIYPGPYSSGTLPDGTQIGIPMHQSEQVMFYNNTWAKELGFDSPPATSAEFKEQACAAAAANNADDNPDNNGTGGMVYFPDASQMIPWIWAFGGDILNADETGYVLNSQAAIDAATFLNDLVTNGCTLTTPSFPNPEFATRLALFASSSSAGIPFQASAMTDAGNADEWSAIPFPGPNGDRYVNAFGQMIGVVKTNPDQDLASWIFLKYLTSPETQSKWIGYTGYFPSQSTTDVGSRPTDDPVWGGALALLELGKAEPNLAAHGSVRGAIRDAFDAVASAKSQDEIVTILNNLNDTAAQLVAESQ
jgi:ABC-type glycerol-3-phosphate transport system substrate-binding protein